MRPPPSLRALPRYPVVGGTALLAIGVTLAWKNGVNMSALFLDPRVRYGELWRLVTSALPHVDGLHLLFNVYWLWVFGTLVEGAFGHLRTLGIVLLLAAGSAAAEYAVFSGGVGLSGVGYGLFAMLWVLGRVRRQDPRFAGAVDPNTAVLFVVWFFLCIVLTVTGAMRVGNVAHGMGAVLGAVLGLAVASRSSRRVRAAWSGLLAALVVGSVLAATVGRPWVNVSRDRGQDEAWLGYQALEAQRNAQAVRLYRDAVRMRPGEAGYWFNLGIAYQRLGRLGEAADAFRRASELDPGNADYRQAAKDARGAAGVRRMGDLAGLKCGNAPGAANARAIRCRVSLGSGARPVRWWNAPPKRGGYFASRGERPGEPLSFTAVREERGERPASGFRSGFV